MKKLDIYMKRIIVMMFIFILGSVTMAYAVAIEATVTADNEYGLYFGTQDGSSITFVGRNASSWVLDETFTFDITAGDYIYIAAWSDGSTAQGILGQFVISDWSTTILTNTSDWEVYLTFDDKDIGSPAPTELDMESEVSGASWYIVSDFIGHGSSPWGYISGISSNADWIWGSDLMPGSHYGEYQIFRVIPEPGTMFLLGLGGLALLRKRRA